MNLLIDWGNTRLKYLLVTDLADLLIQDSPVQSKIADSPQDLILQLSPILQTNSIIHILLSSVRSDEDNSKLLGLFDEAGFTVFMATTDKEACGVECGYVEPELLGVDRWLAIIAGYRPNKATGIIDLGSAITLDIVDPRGKHLGGHILPGKKLLLDSLKRTANVRTKGPLTEIPQFVLGRSTTECVDFGIQQMMRGYLVDSILRASAIYNIDRWLLTGGGGAYWTDILAASRLNNQFPEIIASPNLVFQGLAMLFRDSHPIYPNN